MMSTGMPRLLAALATTVAMLLAERSEALHNNSPLLTQVTDRPSQTIGGVHFTMASNVMIFHSDADLLSNGNTVPQIFVFDTAKRILKDQRAFYQLTFGSQPSINPSATARARTLAFESAADHLGNGSTGRQIFASRLVRFKNPGGLALQQITKGLGESFNPKINASGRYLVFSSTGDMNGDGLAPGEHLYRSELRRLRKARCAAYPCPYGGLNPGLELVTREIATGAAIHPGGNFVVFESRGDAAGNGCVNGAQQLFVKDFKTGTIQQLTFGTADSRGPKYSRDGQFLFFESDADLALTGSTRTQIFQYDMFTVPPRLKQLTAGTDGDSTDPAPGPGGAIRIHFTSTADLTNSGVSGVRRLFVYELTRNQIFQLSGNQQIDPGIDANFSFSIFVSDSDWLGNGNNQKQLFFLNSYRVVGDPGSPPPRPTPTATPIPGVPTTIGLALTANLSEDNGDGTLTTVVASTVADYLGAPVANGIFVDFSITAPSAGAAISDGRINVGSDQVCNLVQFQQRTGVPIVNQPGKTYVCLTYPKEQVNTVRQVNAAVTSRCLDGVNDTGACSSASQCPGGACQPASASVSGFFTLPAPIQECLNNGVPCNDFDPCTLNDVCGGGTNTCVGGDLAGQACTENSQCACPPSNPTCISGYCQLPTCQPGAPITCANDGNLCTQDVCNFYTGECYTPKQCFDDGNLCTDDVCDPGTGLCGIPNTAPCSDDNPCTLDDICAAGSCAPGTLMTCPNDGNPCTDDVCNAETGQCGVPGVCDCP
ncbi:MAG: PD40 domain-containing protein [Deltaproteobacteria bacterium]|nr:PD40 domain-containing protein [Deltaproteobacteria bacterium]